MVIIRTKSRAGNSSDFRLITCMLFFLLLLIVNSCRTTLSLNYPGKVAIKENGDTLYYHLGINPSGKLNEKLLVILQGSEHYSVRRLFGYGAEASMFGYDILLINKFAFYDSARYRESNCFERRVDDVAFVIKDVQKRVYRNGLKNIVLLGGSEGGVIAPFVASRNPEVKQLIIMGAGGMPQSKEFEILIKRIPESRNYFFENGVSDLNELKAKLNEIRNSSEMSNSWMGYSYKYWKSYIDTSFMEVIAGLSIPVLIVSGSEDEMMPVESVELVKSKLGDRGNIRVEVIAGADHQFRDKGNGKPMLPMLYKKVILPWLEEAGALR